MRNGWTLVAVAFGGYAIYVSAHELWRPVRQRHSRGEPLAAAAGEDLVGRGRRRAAAYVAHAGAVVVMVAIAVSSTMGTHKEVQLRQGESVTVGRYSLTFLGAERKSEPHREALVANVAVYRGQENLGVLSPRMNQYPTQREPIGTPAVKSSLREDLYLSAMNIDAERGTVGLLAIVNPMVVWLWIATGVTALGGLIALLPRRRPRVATVAAAAPAVPPSAATAG
jgi:cytochrome c-type biogenesis protein CcmF